MKLTHFSIATTPRCTRGHYSFPRIVPLTLDPYLIMLSIKQGSIKYHFLSFWYESTWDWTLISWAIGKHSNHYANGSVNIYIYIYIYIYKYIEHSGKAINRCHSHTVKLFIELSTLVSGKAKCKQTKATT